MAERFKAHAWRACGSERASWVRIPASPPVFFICPMIKKILPPLQSQSLSIIIPAYNERENIATLLDKLYRIYTDKLKFFPETIIINDASTDGSNIILEELRGRFPFYETIHHSKKLGLTEVLKTAIRRAKKDWLFLMPADLEFDPEADLMPIFLKAEEGWDVVAGWRQKRAGIKKHISHIANLVMRYSFKVEVHDINWVKLIRRDAIDKIVLENGYYKYIIPMLHALGYRITEVKTGWYPRKHGSSKFHIMHAMISLFGFYKAYCTIRHLKSR